MTEGPNDPSSSCHMKAIAAAYLRLTHGDPSLALHYYGDDLADLMEAERRTRERSRLISKGCVRGRLEETGNAL